MRRSTMNSSGNSLPAFPPYASETPWTRRPSLGHWRQERSATSSISRGRHPSPPEQNWSLEEGNPTGMDFSTSRPFSLTALPQRPRREKSYLVLLPRSSKQRISPMRSASPTEQPLDLARRRGHGTTAIGLSSSPRSNRDSCSSTAWSYPIRACHLAV